jgi:hypothetical protein
MERCRGLKISSGRSSRLSTTRRGIRATARRSFTPPRSRSHGQDDSTTPPDRRSIQGTRHTPAGRHGVGAHGPDHRTGWRLQEGHHSWVAGGPSPRCLASCHSLLPNAGTRPAPAGRAVSHGPLTTRAHPPARAGCRAGGVAGPACPPACSPWISCHPAGMSGHSDRNDHPQRSPRGGSGTPSLMPPGRIRHRPGGLSRRRAGAQRRAGPRP